MTGFRATGMCPFDPKAISGEVFAPPLVPEKEHGESEAPGQPVIRDRGTKYKKTDDRKQRESYAYSDDESLSSGSQDDGESMTALWNAGNTVQCLENAIN
jgi:hypothetical protein